MAKLAGLRLERPLGRLGPPTVHFQLVHDYFGVEGASRLAWPGLARKFQGQKWDAPRLYATAPVTFSEVGWTEPPEPFST